MSKRGMRWSFDWFFLSFACKICGAGDRKSDPDDRKDDQDDQNEEHEKSTSSLRDENSLTEDNNDTVGLDGHDIEDKKDSPSVDSSKAALPNENTLTDFEEGLQSPILACYSHTKVCLSEQTAFNAWAVCAYTSNLLPLIARGSPAVKIWKIHKLTYLPLSRWRLHTENEPKQSSCN